MFCAIMKWLPLLLIAGQGAGAVDRGLRTKTRGRDEREKEFNLTTISPDDETIDSLLNGVDSAVGTLQSAIDYPDYPVEPGSLDSGEEQQDFFTGEGDYYQDLEEEYEEEYGQEYEEEYEEEYGEPPEREDEVEEEEDDAIVIEEATAGAAVFNRTVSFPQQWILKTAGYFFFFSFPESAKHGLHCPHLS